MPNFAGAGASAVSITGMPQVVPADYVGLHFRAWPLYNPVYWGDPRSTQPGMPTGVDVSPAGVSYGTVRLHDCSYNMWYQIETSAGVYSAAALSSLDTIISAHRAGGKTIIFTVYATPQFWVNSGDAGYNGDWYTGKGANCYPSAAGGLAALGSFVTMIMNRYNKAGGSWYDANFATLGKGIQVIEAWNEPMWNNGPTNPGVGAFLGTAAQMVDMAFTIKTAAKAVDSAVVFSSPGFSTAVNVQYFLQATGAINVGVSGASLVEVIGVHNYNVNLPGMTLNNWGFDAIAGPTVGFNVWKAAAVAGGASSVPLWMNEGGFDYHFTIAELTLLAAATPEYRKTFWARQMMLGAALGYKRWISYCWDGPYLNKMMTDPNGATAALNLIASQVAGKTINAASYTPGGPVTLRFSDSTSLTV